MKTIFRIATEQYCYAEIELDSSLKPEEVKELYDAYTSVFKPQLYGIPEKEMNPVIDKMLNGETVEGGIEIYEKMSQSQKYAAQTLKRALARIKSRESKPVIEKE